METGIVGSSYSTTSTTKKNASGQLDKDAFLMLLVTQLQNQDPTTTQDTNQMVQQMTSYASLEQMQNQTGLLQGLQVQNQGLFQAQAANLVGKRVRIGSGSFQLKDGKASLGIELASQANVTVTIKDANGNVVATLDKGSMGAGNQSFEWDGKDAQGKALPDGSYTISVSAKDAKGATVNASTSVYARVDSLSFADGGVYIMAGGKRYAVSEISEISA